jgi:uncharacterized protein
MIDKLKQFIEIQELDIKMIRLMKLKHERQDEILTIQSLRNELVEELGNKHEEIKEIKEELALTDQKISEHKLKIKQLEEQQSSIKKIEEFNAYNKEITHLDKEKSALEQTYSDLADKCAAEEKTLSDAESKIDDTDKHNQEIEHEVLTTLKEINVEGKDLQIKKGALIETCDQDILVVYNKLLRNKIDRVIVPLENRICTGCHIALTPQHENLVRKDEKLVFCEHCSRIHYWTKSDTDEPDEAAPKRRRRKKTVTV